MSRRSVWQRLALCVAVASGVVTTVAWVASKRLCLWASGPVPCGGLDVAFGPDAGLWLTWFRPRTSLTGWHVERLPRRSDGSGPITGATAAAHHLLGFGWEYDSDGTHRDAHVVSPVWPAPVVAAALTVYLLGRRQRPSGFRCRSCGYDLRATPDRCPECGVAAPRAVEREGGVPR